MSTVVVHDACIFSKVIEKVICIQINDFFVENKLFFNH